MPTTALIPAAGRGARLDRPNTPKPLVHVGGKPLLLSLLQRLEKAGVERAVVVTGFGSERVVRELTNHPDLSLKVEFVEHAEWQQGLASTLLAAKGHIDENFVIAMADHVFDQKLVDAMVAAEPGDDVGVALVDTDVTEVFELEDAVKVTLEGDRLTTASRTLKNPDAVDAGLFAFTPVLFEALEEARKVKEPASLTDALALLGERGQVRVITTERRAWHDIDTPQSLVRAEMAHRAGIRKAAVHRPEFKIEQGRTTHSYDFIAGAPVKTEIHVQRGFVRNPERLQLIPDESASSPIYVFTDTTVNGIYGDDFVDGLDRMGYDVRRIVMKDGEESKSMANYVKLVDQILAEGIDERSVLISLGGGAVANVCGFIASTLYRGIGLVHVPTTLMAQCDASISHKQGINGARGKNLVGSYYSPIAIAVDVEVLATLEDWLIPDGLSEVIKHALGQDRDYLDYLLGYEGKIDDPDFLETVVRKNIELKCELVAIDPKEHREGMVLQYGHEVGHPVEYLSGYDLNHGQSVAIGMMVAARVARLMGACDDAMIDLHRQVIEKFELPTRIPAHLKVDDILASMRYNKRYLTEGTRMALLDGPGSLWQVEDDYAIPVPTEVLIEAIRQSF